AKCSSPGGNRSGIGPLEGSAVGDLISKYKQAAKRECENRQLAAETRGQGGVDHVDGVVMALQSKLVKK
ncbi:MAG: hypothetical protein AAF531_28055, partial [Actinomycetota bacterium]